MNIHLTAPTEVLPASAAAHILDTQDLGVDRTGYQTLIASRPGKAPHPCPLGTVTREQLQRAVALDYDLLFLLGDTQGEDVAITECVLVIRDPERAAQARAALDRQDPGARARLETLTRLSVQHAFEQARE